MYLSTQGWSGKSYGSCCRSRHSYLLCQHAAAAAAVAFRLLWGVGMSSLAQMASEGELEILWKRGAVLLIHKLRTMEENLISFELDCLLEIFLLE